ncbi:MAG: ankyrin repeat domain-containing protein [Comamonadaceae bacterium]|nr:ankyrin repeat domain-containing protein [Comamonadaceae bacterium]
MPVVTRAGARSSQNAAPDNTQTFPVEVPRAPRKRQHTEQQIDVVATGLNPQLQLGRSLSQNDLADLAPGLEQASKRINRSHSENPPRQLVALSERPRPNELNALDGNVFNKALVRGALICLMGETAYEAGGGDAGMQRMLHQRWEDGNTALTLAAESNQCWILAALIRQGADPTATCADGLSPLMVAAAKGYTQCVETLTGVLGTPEHVNWVNAEGVTALSVAAQSGHTGCVKELIRALETVDHINRPNIYGVTPLIAAVHNNHTDCAKALVGALRTAEQINWVDEQGFTALIVAAQKGHTDCVRVLIGALKTAEQINRAGPEGFTALIAAAHAGHADCVRELVDALKTADQINRAGPRGFTALICAAHGGHADCVRQLIGALKTAEQINRAGPQGFTALMVAAHGGHADCVREFVDALKTADQINRAGPRGFTALICAAQNGHTDCVVQLSEALQTAEQINRANNDGFTALMTAAMEGEAGSVRALIHQLQHEGGSIHALGPEGLTALSVASQLRQIEVVNLLLDALQTNGRAPDTPNEVDQETVAIAGLNGHTGVLCTWLACTGQVGLITTFFEGLGGHTPNQAEAVLLHAAELGNAPAVALLLRHGTYAHGRRADGEGVLELAAAKGHWPVLEVWKAAGHDLPRRFIMEAMRASGLYLETPEQPLSIESTDVGQANLLIKAISNEWPHLAEALIQMKTQDLFEKMSLA